MGVVLRPRALPPERLTLTGAMTWRPFFRRAFSTFWPFLLAMRLMKPEVRCRRLQEEGRERGGRRGAAVRVATANTKEPQAGVSARLSPLGPPEGELLATAVAGHDNDGTATLANRGAGRDGAGGQRACEGCDVRHRTLPKQPSLRGAWLRAHCSTQ